MTLTRQGWHLSLSRIGLQNIGPRPVKVEKAVEQLVPAPHLSLDAHLVQLVALRGLSLVMSI